MQKKYQITMTEAQMQTLAGLIDAGVKTIGMRSVKDAAELLPAIESAKELIDGQEKVE